MTLLGAPGLTRSKDAARNKAQLQRQLQHTAIPCILEVLVTVAEDEVSARRMEPVSATSGVVDVGVWMALGRCHSYLKVPF